MEKNKTFSNDSPDTSGRCILKENLHFSLYISLLFVKEIYLATNQTHQLKFKKIYATLIL